ncbi:MAG: aminotransferase class V-fold PLP-dependent enzyme [Minwuia sp.]|uniref:aminotransferase class V-fold PLP-dependent enzyme n=1 Tax=Minwuia sp. TaxID=2493630 RepID=UPI003A838D14
MPDLLTITDQEVDRFRRETPGAGKVLHFNNAGAGLMPRRVLDAVKAHLDLEAETGGYEAAATARPKLERAYSAIAGYLNCDPSEVAVMENATAAWNQAFFAVLGTMKAGETILTAEAEYASNYLSYLMARERYGIEIEVVPSDGDGELDLDALERLIDGSVRLIAVTHIPTNGGLVNPAEEIGRIARRHGIAYLLDACQSAGQRELDVRKIGCDFLSATGRKYLRGPRGTGFLYAGKAAAERFPPPVIDLHAARWDGRDHYNWAEGAARYENWENYEAGKIGLGVAVDLVLEIGAARIEKRVEALAGSLRERLEAEAGVAVHDIGRTRSGICTFTHPRLDATAVKTALGGQGINVSTSTVYSTRIDMEKRGLPDLVRASVHYYNTENEVDRFVEAVARL